MPEDSTSPLPIAYTVGQFCKAAQISRSTLYKLWASGEGPPRCELGRKLIIPRDEAINWIQRKAVVPNGTISPAEPKSESAS